MTDIFQPLRLGQVSEELDAIYPFYPLTTPQMPLPGPDFIANAVALGDAAPVIMGKGDDKRVVQHGDNLHYLYRRALYDPRFELPVQVKEQVKMAPFVPGHIYGINTECDAGPKPTDIMIIGKMPGREEVEKRHCFVGPSSTILIEALQELGMAMEHTDVYVTNIVKWPLLDDKSDSIPMAHKKDCELLLWQEILLVRPKYILCLGSEASKQLLGTQHGVNNMVGRVEKLIIPTDIPGQYHTIKVMAATHPAAVHRTPELYPAFKDQLRLFVSLANGGEVGGHEKFINHVNVYKQRQLREIVDRIRRDSDPLRRIIAVDGEWQGESPNNAGSYLRTVQFSTAHGEAYCVVLRHEGGAPAFVPSVESAIDELKRLLLPDPEANYFPRPGGHFMRADLPWLIDAGLDIRDGYAPAARPEDCREQGGWDTGLMYHAVNEATSYRLTDMMVRLTTAPVYDTLLKDAITTYCTENKIKKDDLEGYGFLPKWILHPEPYDPEWGSNYAQYDADVTRRSAMRLMCPGGLLDADWNGNSSWEPYWRNHRASLGVLEMEMTGIELDKHRVDELTSLYMYAVDQLLANFRQQINWPTFNPNSQQQCVAFLFGDHYMNKFDKITKQPVVIRPPGALCLGLTPIKTTGKRPRLWADVVTKNEMRQYTPSTDREALGILGHHHPLAMMLRDIKFVSKILTGALRLPVTDDAGTIEVDEDGFQVYEKGLAAAVQDDGRVHTHISQNKETGRSSSARPPLQNISSRREGDYSRILGVWQGEGDQRKVKGDYKNLFPQPLYRAPIRSIFKATDGYVLVEADYTGAELAALAWMSGDPVMIEHVRRNILPEDHPDYFDIHANRAVSAFRLSCPPTKAGMKAAGVSPLRVASKNINFGIPYGRSAEAIARQCKEENVDVTVEECQTMMDGYFNEYRYVERFLAECRRRSQQERWMTGAFGRYRRFVKSSERSVIGEQERQAQNFPIQNTVADAMWTAVWNFMEYRRQNPQWNFKLLLQIHDALLFEVPIAELEYFKTVILPKCMVEDVPIWPRYLDNTPMPVAEPYRFGIDCDVEVNWGEEISDELAEKLGISHLV